MDDNSLTIERPPESTGGPAAGASAERTLTFGPETRVQVPVQKGEMRTAAGVNVPRFVSAPGKVSDLSVGQTVVVEVPVGGDGDTASRIFVQPTDTVIRAERPAPVR